jgi:DHA1 family multidrug resistance protein-like MFS transporter
MLGAWSQRTPLDPDAAIRRRNLFAVSVASFMASIGFMVVMPLLPGLLHEVTADAASIGLWLGLAVSVAPLMTAATGPFWTTMGERFGHKLMIERSLITVGVAIGALYLVGGALEVVGLRAVIGALGGTSVAALAAITAGTPRRELGPAVGMLQAAQTAGAMAGPAIGGLFGAVFGMRPAFIAAGLIFVVALLVVHLLYRDSSSPRTSPRAAPERAAVGTSGLGGALWLVLIAAFLIQYVEGSLMVVMPLYFHQLGVPADDLAWTMGIGLSLTYLAASVAAALGGRLAGRWSPLMLLIIAAGVGMVALVALAMTDTTWQFIAVRVISAIVLGAAPTLAYAAGATLARPEQRAKVVGLVSSAGILGWAASPMVTGFLAEVNQTLVFALNAALYAILAAALGTLTLGRRPAGMGDSVPRASASS